VFQVEKHTHGTTPCLPACPADVSGDGVVNVTDLLAVIEAWGSADVNADINTDGLVDVSDLLELVSNWGAC